MSLPYTSRYPFTWQFEVPKLWVLCIACIRVREGSLKQSLLHDSQSSYLSFFLVLSLSLSLSYIVRIKFIFFSFCSFLYRVLSNQHSKTWLFWYDLLCKIGFNLLKLNRLIKYLGAIYLSFYSLSLSLSACLW